MKKRTGTIGLGISLLLAGGAWSQTTQRVSLATGGGQGGDHSGSDGISASADGRWIAFTSLANDLVPGDTNGTPDVFVRDRATGTTERVSVSSAGSQGNFGHGAPSISADGRYVAFASDSLRLVPGDTNWRFDIFVRDRQTGTTQRVSVDSGGAQADGHSYSPSISGDGRYVAFASEASNLVAGDTNGVADVFVHDRQLGATERVSVDPSGNQVLGESWYPAISADGLGVGFISLASDLVPNDTNGGWDVFHRDLSTDVTERVSVGSLGGGGGYFHAPSLSGDGRYVVFSSLSGDLVPGDTNSRVDVFVRDRQAATTERVSVDSGGLEADGDCNRAAISADGSLVAFESDADNLVPGDTNGQRDVFLRDRSSGTTGRASVGAGGVQGNGQSADLSISADGRFVVFGSLSSNLVPGDTNAKKDVFLHDRLGGTSFASLCDPGVGGVVPCPCSNPPGGPGRGCDNSSATGGAILSASGGTYLSSDSLVFTTLGEKPTALSILTQWKNGSAAGATFGMGVRCTSGTFKRLYTKSAVGGSITAPDFGAGDAPVSLRAAALGDTILPGESRWHFVHYRDTTVLGGCPATSTFNATQTGQVTWSP